MNQIRKIKLTYTYVKKILEYQKKDSNHSFFIDNEKDIWNLEEENAEVFGYFENKFLQAIAILDKVEDNHSIEIIGPYGPDDLQKKLMEFIRHKYPKYSLLLFIKKENPLCKLGTNSIWLNFTIDKKNLNNIWNSPYIISPNDYNQDFIQLHQNIFKQTYADGNTLLKNGNTNFVFVENKVLKGYISFNSNESYIDYIGVKEEFRHQGIGKSLLCYALQQMNGNVIHLTVHETNLNAIQLYSSVGFHLEEKMVAVKIKASLPL